MTGQLYLSSLTLAGDRSSDALLGDFVRVHRLVCAGLGGGRAQAEALHYTEPERSHILVQSAIRPDWDSPEVVKFARVRRRAVKDIGSFHDRVRLGDKLSVRLVAVPGKKNAKVNGGRLQPAENSDAAMRWLERRLLPAAVVLEIGAEKLSVRSAENRGIDPYGVNPDQRPRVTLSPWEYRGLIGITDPEEFRRRVRTGLGPGKAYGFGMIRFTYA